MPVIERIKTEPSQVQHQLIVGIGTVHTLILQIELVKFGCLLLLRQILHCLYLVAGVRIRAVCRHHLIQQEQNEGEQKEHEDHVQQSLGNVSSHGMLLLLLGFVETSFFRRIIDKSLDKCK